MEILLRQFVLPLKYIVTPILHEFLNKGTSLRTRLGSVMAHNSVFFCCSQTPKKTAAKLCKFRMSRAKKLNNEIRASNPDLGNNFA